MQTSSMDLIFLPMHVFPALTFPYSTPTSTRLLGFLAPTAAGYGLSPFPLPISSAGEAAAWWTFLPPRRGDHHSCSGRRSRSRPNPLRLPQAKRGRPPQALQRRRRFPSLGCLRLPRRRPPAAGDVCRSEEQCRVSDGYRGREAALECRNAALETVF